MKTRKKKRLLAALLCMCLFASVFPLPDIIYAAEVDCNHVHDELDCGYTEAEEEQPCTFQHTHDDACGYTEAEEATPCTAEEAHVHDTTVCEYVEGAEGTPCNHVHDENCGGLTADSLEQNEPQIISMEEEADEILQVEPLADETAIDSKGYTFNQARGKLTVSTNGGTTAWKQEIEKSDVKILEIQEGVTAINAYIFMNCTSLTEVTISGSVETIGEQAFAGCTNLTSLTISNGVKTIGKYAFGGCTSLSNVTIPRSVETIVEQAFRGCTSLSSVVILDGVKSIGEYMFYDCTSLSSVIIPKSVETIGDFAFGKCTELTSVIIPNGVKTIGSNAFYYCEKLTSVTIPKSVKVVDKYAFVKCTGLISVTISNGVETIGEDAFQSCTALTSVTIPGSVKNIGKFAFYECTNLKRVTILDGVETIGERAFWKCTGLLDVIIPGSVESIGNYAFNGCNNLKSLTINRFTAPSLGGNSVFPYDPKNLTIYVPNGASGYTENKWPTASRQTTATVDENQISGVNAPVRGEMPVTKITDTDQYIGIVEWSPALTADDKFAADTVYTATITLAPGPRYTLDDVTKDFFSVEGATSATNDAGSGVITAVFPKTNKIPINLQAIEGITVPVRGIAAATTITETEQYTGEVSWLPKLPSDGRFAANIQYTATITLTPKDRYTLENVRENFFTVAGATSVTNDANSGVITAVFPKTAPIPHSHSYGDWKSDGTDHWRQCSCGSISDKASHDFSKWTVDQKPDEDGKVSSSRECTVCGYKQTEKHVPQTLTDPEAGVTVKGDFTSGAAISVKEAVLHEEGTCKVCDEIRARQADGELIVLYDISLTSGINSGEMEISIPVDEKYNGQTVILLHCMDKEEERLEVKVEKGLVTFTTKSLSPFAILDTKKAESIKLASSSLTLEIGKSRQLTYTVTPENIHSDKVTWTTSDKKVATVSPSGKVQAVKAGTAAITCTAADGGGAKATCKVTVKNTATPLLNLRGTAGKNSIRLNWNQISNADGYEIYGSRCGSRYSYGKVKTITKGSMKTWTQKGLRSGTAYKYYIKAYKLVNGKKLYLKTSLTSHVATTGSRYTNTKTVTTTFTDITLAKGKTRQISARITPVKKGGKLANHVPEFRYKTTNSKVATVNASGKITAAGKGKCSVYVYANNGVTRRIMITVK